MDASDNVCYIFCMHKIDKKFVSEAASKWVDMTLSNLNISNRGFDRMSEGAITYNHLRDLRLHLKGSLGVDEFVEICEVLELDLASSLNEILDIAAGLERQARLAAAEAKLRAPGFRLAALHDPNKDAEAGASYIEP